MAEITIYKDLPSGLDLNVARIIQAYYLKKLNVDVFIGGAVSGDNSVSVDKTAILTKGAIDSGDVTIDEIVESMKMSKISIQSLINGERLLMSNAMERLNLYITWFFKGVNEMKNLIEVSENMGGKLTKSKQTSTALAEVLKSTTTDTPDDPNHGGAL